MLEVANNTTVRTGFMAQIMETIKAGHPVPPPLKRYEAQAREILAAEGAQQTAPKAPVVNAATITAQLDAYNGRQPVAPMIPPTTPEVPAVDPLSVEGLSLEPLEAETAPVETKATPDMTAIQQLIEQSLKPITERFAADAAQRDAQVAKQAEEARVARIREQLASVNLADPQALQALTLELAGITTAPPTTNTATPPEQTATPPASTEPQSTAMTATVELLEAQMPGFKAVLKSKQFAEYGNQLEPLGLTTLGNRVLEGLNSGTPQGSAVVLKIVKDFIAHQRNIPATTPAQGLPVQTLPGVATPNQTATPQAPPVDAKAAFAEIEAKMRAGKITRQEATIRKAKLFNQAQGQH